MATLTGDGVLTAGAAAIAGLGAIHHVGSGALIAAAATLPTTGKRGASGASVLVAGSATTDALGIINNGGNLLAGLAEMATDGYISVTVSADIEAGDAVLAVAAAIYVPDTGTLLAGDAVLAAVGHIAHVGDAVLIADAAELLAEGIKGVFLSGTTDIGLLPEGVVAPAILGESTAGFIVEGSVSKKNTITGTVLLSLEPTGTLLFESAASSNLESAYELTGVRPSLPTLIYVLDAVTSSQITIVPFDRSFLVAPHFSPSPGDPFTEAGAAPLYIGTKLKADDGTPYAVFRRPIANEVVWLVPDNVLYRYETDRDTNAIRWVKYRSLPQRVIENQFVFSMFDPEKVYDYYALIWGGLMWRWAYDTAVIANQFDPDRCATQFLGLLAAQFGYDLPPDETLPARRALTRNAVPSFKFKGLVEAVRLRMQSLGYIGYVNEIWVNPDNPGNGAYESLVPLNLAGEPSVQPGGAGVDYIERPHGYDTIDPTDHWPSSRMILHINSSDGSPIDFVAEPGVLARAIRALRNDTLPVHVDIRYVSTDHSLEQEAITVGDQLDIFDVNILSSTSMLVASATGMSALGTVS